MDDVAVAIPASAPERRLSFAFAKRHGVLVKRYVDGVAECAYRADTTPMALAELRRFLRTKVKLERVDENKFDALLRTAYEGGNSATMQAAEGLEESTDLAHLALELPDQADLLESEDDAPIIRLINAVLTQAVKENASDIHVEPMQGQVRVRYRVDGALSEAIVLPAQMAAPIASRIKVLAELNIVETTAAPGRPVHRHRGRAAHRHPGVGGRHHPRREGRPATPRHHPFADQPAHPGNGRGPGGAVPHHGPRRAAWCCAPDPPDRARRRRCTPTLAEVNDPTRNVVTIEDPVEYHFSGVNQMQVSDAGISFAAGLRGILRQDPDVILVGRSATPRPLASPCRPRSPVTS